MSSDEAEQLMESFEKWDSKHAKQSFISKMERKMHRKEKGLY
jgi:hypothetical protein